MKLCEIVLADKTAPDALTHRRLDRAQIRKGAGRGRRLRWLCRNRMLSQRGKQSEKLLFEGALPRRSTPW